MRFAIIDQAERAGVVAQAEVVLQRGAPPALADDGHRWFSSRLGAGHTSAIGFAPGGLDLHGITVIPWYEGRLIAWALRLWRPADLVTIFCCVAELDWLPEDERDRGVRVLIDRLTRYGEGAAVIIAGGFAAAEGDRLVDSGLLCRVAAGEDRILVAPGIGVTSHEPAHGVIDLEIRHQRQLISERCWTEPGAEITKIDWWYQPERAARVRCAGYAEAEQRLGDDSWGGGTIALTYQRRNPDGTLLEPSTSAGSAQAGLRIGDRILARRFIVPQPNRRADFDTAAEALRCGWAWAADEVVEELTVGRDAATAVVLQGDRVRIRPDWG